MNAIWVRVGRRDSIVAGVLYHAGGRYGFAYSSEYLAASDAPPLDPFCLPKTPEHFYSTGNALDGALTVFGACVPVDPTASAVYGLMMRRLRRCSSSFPDLPRTPLTMLVLGTAMGNLPGGVNGMFYDVIPASPSFPGRAIITPDTSHIYRDVLGLATTSTAGCYDNFNGFFSAYAAAYAGQADSHHDAHLANLLPLGGRSLKFSQSAHGMAGYFVIERDPIADVRMIRVRHACLGLAMRCGISTVRSTLNTLANGVTFAWQSLAPGIMTPVTAMRTYRADVPRDNNTPLEASYLLDSMDPSIYLGDQPWHVYGRIIRGLSSRTDHGEAFRRMCFRIFSGQYPMSTKYPYMTPVKSGNSPTQYGWGFSPLFSLDPRGLPYKTATRMRHRLIPLAAKAGLALGLNSSVVEADINTVVLGFLRWPRIAKQFSLTAYERGYATPALVIPATQESLCSSKLTMASRVLRSQRAGRAKPKLREQRIPPADTHKIPPQTPTSPVAQPI